MFAKLRSALARLIAIDAAEPVVVRSAVAGVAQVVSGILAGHLDVFAATGAFTVLAGLAASMKVSPVTTHPDGDVGNGSLGGTIGYYTAAAETAVKDVEAEVPASPEATKVEADVAEVEEKAAPVEEAVTEVVAAITPTPVPPAVAPTLPPVSDSEPVPVPAAVPVAVPTTVPIAPVPTAAA